MQPNPREESLILQLQLIKAQLEQLEKVKEFLKNLSPGRKIYINLGEVMVESNYLEAIQYLEEKEKELKALLLQLESQVSQAGLGLNLNQK
ncbi:MAG: prefoldin subunit [Aquificae bacterium]|jgi:chaperonin cofactor prefoldin|nr:prefoldin subunit [Aquificota bacterium]